ncbi:FadR/GntR family transcriptional regulator [Pseudohalioglobus lutimaris]|uniref:FadR family transcriptional regulator n=1 Tax=Pseudohalioglobus lutimaris TaxID=1737061 RepID=A0A2N5X2B0_9GAMM|nr:FadR/GntR family transcriptional regulator [Pseudohalioglobus lutimaris]PLW68590.1 FadR family transcriptional regulator [Pseudohalioglobus lutimaris]
MEIKAVKTRRLYLQVAEQLVAVIQSGSIGAGERLPAERDLAERFGVSRPTIREAMIALEIAGLVEIRSGSGVYVVDNSAPFTPVAADQGPGPFEILEARRLFEGEACALAAERITNEQIASLKSLLAEMEQENRQHGAQEKADQQFHCLIAEAAGNSAISATVNWLWQLRNESEISQRFHQRVREEGIKPIIEDHRRILQALEERDPASSRRAMAAHLQRVIDHLLESQ